MGAGSKGNQGGRSPINTALIILNVIVWGYLAVHMVSNNASIPVDAAPRPQGRAWGKKEKDSASANAFVPPVHLAPKKKATTGGWDAESHARSWGKHAALCGGEGYPVLDKTHNSPMHGDVCRDEMPVSLLGGGLCGGAPCLVCTRPM